MVVMFPNLYRQLSHTQATNLPRATNHMCATSWLCVTAMSCFERMSADLGSTRYDCVLPVIKPYADRSARPADFPTQQQERTQFSIAPTDPISETKQRARTNSDTIVPESKSLAWGRRHQLTYCPAPRGHTYHQGVQLRQRVLDVEHRLVQREDHALDVQRILRLRDVVRGRCARDPSNPALNWSGTSNIAQCPASRSLTVRFLHCSLIRPLRTGTQM